MSRHKKVIVVMVMAPVAVALLLTIGLGKKMESHSNGSALDARRMGPIDTPKDETDLINRLFLAVNTGDITAVQLICDQGADVSAKNRDGMSPLHRAAVKNYPDIATVLLDSGAAIDQIDERGWTALHVASMSGSTEVARLLLDTGADAERKDKLGRTAMHWAKRQNHEGVVEALSPPVKSEKSKHR